MTGPGGGNAAGGAERAALAVVARWDRVLYLAKEWNLARGVIFFLSRAEKVYSVPFIQFRCGAKTVNVIAPTEPGDSGRGLKQPGL